jgi:hypothetical protein
MNPLGRYLAVGMLAVLGCLGVEAAPAKLAAPPRVEPRLRQHQHGQSSRLRRARGRLSRKAFK